MREAVQKLVEKLVDDKEAVSVSEIAKDTATVLEVRVAPSDVGKIIGREGRTARALRSLLFAAGQKAKRRYLLDIAD